MAEEKQNKVNAVICSVGLLAITKFFVRAVWFNPSARSALVPGGVISVVLTCAPPRLPPIGLEIAAVLVAVSVFSAPTRNAHWKEPR